MKQINSNRFSVNFFDNLLYESETKEQSNESIIDEAARYLFDEGDAEYLPDYEEFNGYTMSIRKDLFKKAKERALNALEVLTNHEYEDYDGGNGTLLELNDNHTINELEDNGKDIEEWYSIIDSKKAAFEAETGVELYFAGRSGRHVCVEPTYDNCLNYEHLQEVQERLEEEAVKEFNNINESDTMLEAQHKTQKAEYTLIPANEPKIKELEGGSAFTWEGLDISPKSLNSVVEFFKENTPNIKLPVEFFTWKGSEMNRIYGLTGDNAYPDDLNFVSIALDNWDGMGALPMIKFQVGARWLDDIVDNNARRQGNLDESDVNEAIEKDGGPFPYLMKHGQGPGTLPKDVKVVKYGESDKDKDIVYLDKVLTAEEESKYDLKPMEKLEDCGKAIKEDSIMDDGTPSDIVADNIMHADSDPRFQSKEQVSDEQLASDLAYFALDTTDENFWDEYTDDEYYEKNKKDYLRQINDKKFIDGVLDLLKTRKNNLDGAEDEEYGSSNLDRLIAKFEKKADELTGQSEIKESAKSDNSEATSKEQYKNKVLETLDKLIEAFEQYEKLEMIENSVDSKRHEKYVKKPLKKGMNGHYQYWVSDELTRTESKYFEKDILDDYLNQGESYAPKNIFKREEKKYRLIIERFCDKADKFLEDLSKTGIDEKAYKSIQRVFNTIDWSAMYTSTNEEKFECICKINKILKNNL